MKYLVGGKDARFHILARARHFRTIDTHSAATELHCFARVAIGGYTSVERVKTVLPGFLHRTMPELHSE